MRWNCLSDVYLSERSRAIVYINLHGRIVSTACDPWSAPFPKMIKYFVETKNTLNNERYRDLLISILSYDEVSACLAVGEGAKLKFVER